jgi:hypothetical protein
LKGGVAVVDEFEKGPLVDAGFLQRWCVGGHEAAVFRAWTLLGNYNGQSEGTSSCG